MSKRDEGAEQGGNSVAAWLTRVTRNYCFDQLRKRRSQKNALGDEQEPEVFELTAGNEASPEHRAAARTWGATCNGPSASSASLIAAS